MPCYYPILALQPSAGGPLVFPSPGTSYLYNDYNERTIACGRCSGCRLKRSREWAMRCLHEKQMRKHSCFLTLTLKDSNQLTLIYEQFQAFMKRLRQSASRARERACITTRRPRATPAILCDWRAAFGLRPKTSIRLIPDIAFYMAGEYTEPQPDKGYPGGRPHYHALIFGLDFNDKTYLYTTPAGSNIYRSATLEKIWTEGYSSVGELTFESAAYVARYVMKKRTGDGEKKEYKIIDLETGEINTKTKEFNQMSRRSGKKGEAGIGSRWIKKYKDDVYTTGKVIIRGHKNNPPRYYDKYLKQLDRAALEDFQYARFLEQLEQAEHHTPERLAVQETVAAAKTKSLKRSLA